jgi:2-oxoglutarate dehydrogenase E1 component
MDHGPQISTSACANYCGKVGLEYMHIADTEERRFLQDRIEKPDKTILHPRGQEGDPRP